MCSISMFVGINVCNRQYLEMDLSVSETKAHEVSDVAVKHFVGVLTELRRLFLVEDMVDSLKVFSSTAQLLHLKSMLLLKSM